MHARAFEMVGIEFAHGTILYRIPGFGRFNKERSRLTQHAVVGQAIHDMHPHRVARKNPLYDGRTDKAIAHS